MLRTLFFWLCSAVARKRSRSFCQKCRWQVTVKYAYTLRMWLSMKWHGAWLYGLHRTCAETAAVSCGTSHASAVSTPLRWIFKQKSRYKKLVTHVAPPASAVSLLKRAENKSNSWNSNCVIHYLQCNGQRTLPYHFCCSGGCPRPPRSSGLERVVEPSFFLRLPGLPSPFLISYLAPMEVNQNVYLLTM